MWCLRFEEVGFIFFWGVTAHLRQTCFVAPRSANAADGFGAGAAFNLRWFTPKKEVQATLKAQLSNPHRLPCRPGLMFRLQSFACGLDALRVPPLVALAEGLMVGFPSQVALCGHGTLAAAGALFSPQVSNPHRTLTFHTLSGALAATRVDGSRRPRRAAGADGAGGAGAVAGAADPNAAAEESAPFSIELDFPMNEPTVRGRFAFACFA
jgi:hypothetical protein